MIQCSRSYDINTDIPMMQEK